MPVSEITSGYLEVQDIAERLDLKPKTAWHIVKREIPHEKIGNRIRVTEADFLEWRASKRVVPAKKAVAQ